MNLLNKLTTQELKLLNNAGVNIEDKDYTNEEIRRCEVSVEDFIMSHSSKNGDITVLINKYNEVLNKLIV